MLNFFAFLNSQYANFKLSTKPISILISNFHHQITLLLNYSEKLIFYKIDYETCKQRTSGSAVRKPATITNQKTYFSNFCLKSVNNEINLLQDPN